MDKTKYKNRFTLPETYNAHRYLWAKTSTQDKQSYHPLVLHLLDVACCVEAIVEREPLSTRERFGAILDLGWADAQPWILILTACHDLGKGCPGFQLKWDGAYNLLKNAGVQLPKSPDTKINHGFVSQIALSPILQEEGWPAELAELAADAVGCHHGNRASPLALNDLEGNRRALGNNEWTEFRRDIFNAIMAVFSPSETPTKQTLSGPDFMLLAGLTSFADWIGSNEDWFPFGTVDDCKDLKSWWRRRKQNATHALNDIGWASRTPLLSVSISFEMTFGFPPRPLQNAVAKAVMDIHEPSILLVEAPMGEGKTEAAFFAHNELQRKFGHRGLYIALPTKATGNAMFERTLDFLRSQGSKRNIDLQLLHGATFLNDSFQNLCISGVYDSETGGEIRASEWFTHKKRALLSEYGVGTVDQSLLTILPVRHNFVRLWGLANRVVVFDEIHAYDAYTGTLLILLLQWLLALGSSIILLSATLPPSFRHKLANIVNTELPGQETEYPRISIFRHDAVKQVHFDADPMRRRTIKVVGIEPSLSDVRAAIKKHIPTEGMALALMNTVQRAQDLFLLFPNGEPLEHKGHRVGKRLSDGTEVLLFHARYPAERRQKREDRALATFGQSDERRGRKILIATQVAEQSLDLDFDLMVTDLAPIDLVLQRAGRLWRHDRGTRSISEPVLMIAGLRKDEPPSFGEPLWWGAVYREDVLLRTWSLLRERQTLTLPDEIDTLVQAVYEEQVDVPEFLKELLNNTMVNSDGKALAQRGQANQAIIGFPDDSSWNQPERFVLYDEDTPGVHRTLMAQTRLGEDSVIAIPLSPEDDFRPETTLDIPLAKRLYLRAVNLSRRSVVKNLQTKGVPEGWKKSPLLRNCYPLLLDEHDCWMENPTVRLDNDLGIVYEPKEAE